MFNQNPLNNWSLNSANVPTSIEQDDFVINWFSISNENIKTFFFDDNAQVNLSASSRPQSDWSIFLSNFKEWRQIRLWVYIKWSDKSDFQSKLDELRKNIFKKNIFLDVKTDGAIRRIKVNCISSPKTLQHYNITFLRVEITFQALEPYWYLLQNQSTAIDNVTETFQEEITPIWTAPSDISAYIIFASASWTNQVKMKVWDENELIIDHSFSENDILRIDWENSKVFVNEIEVNYSGIFPIMEVWTNFFTFTINWTFTANVLILNKINYV